MKVLSSALFVFALNFTTTSFAVERMTVTGSRSIGDATPPAFRGGGGQLGAREFETIKSCEQMGTCDGRAGIPQLKPTELGGWKVGDKIAIDAITGTISQFLSRSVSGEAEIRVKVKLDGGNTEIEVWIKVKASSTTN